MSHFGSIKNLIKFKKDPKNESKILINVNTFMINLQLIYLLIFTY